MQYTVVRYNFYDEKEIKNYSEFIKKINELLSNGWEPIGGISFAQMPTGHTYYAQALIKK